MTSSEKESLQKEYFKLLTKHKRTHEGKIIFVYRKYRVKQIISKKYKVEISDVESYLPKIDNNS